MKNLNEFAPCPVVGGRCDIRTCARVLGIFNVIIVRVYIYIYCRTLKYASFLTVPLYLIRVMGRYTRRVFGAYNIRFH